MDCGRNRRGPTILRLFPRRDSRDTHGIPQLTTYCPVIAGRNRYWACVLREEPTLRPVQTPPIDPGISRQEQALPDSSTHSFGGNSETLVHVGLALGLSSVRAPQSGHCCAFPTGSFFHPRSPSRTSSSHNHHRILTKTKRIMIRNFPGNHLWKRIYHACIASSLRVSGWWASLRSLFDLLTHLFSSSSIQSTRFCFFLSRFGSRI